MAIFYFPDGYHSSVQRNVKIQLASTHVFYTVGSNRLKNEKNKNEDTPKQNAVTQTLMLQNEKETSVKKKLKNDIIVGRTSYIMSGRLARRFRCPLLYNMDKKRKRVKKKNPILYNKYYCWSASYRLYRNRQRALSVEHFTSGGGIEHQNHYSDSDFVARKT